MSRHPYDTPTHATAERGEVMLDGPDGIAVSMTPGAARTSADHLRAAADEAQNQQQSADQRQA